MADDNYGLDISFREEIAALFPRILFKKSLHLIQSTALL